MSRETGSLRILFDDGVCEVVDVSHIGERRYRVETTPLASQTSVRFGDVIDVETMDGGVCRFLRIVEGSPFVTLNWSVPSEIAVSSGFERLLRLVDETGGRWERAHGGIIFAHVKRDRADDLTRRYEELLRPTKA